ncbi:MAG: outer membrane protein assembly factor BamE domain-containing protein, partial [Armatimonadaceae bacterium]
MKNPWRSLTKGLSKAQVKGILGSPSRIQSSVIFETWYY